MKLDLSIYSVDSSCKKEVKWSNNIIITFCFFVYIFPFKAYGFEPRLFILIFYMFFGFSEYRSYTRIDINYLKILLCPILMGLLTVFGNIVNQTQDFTFFTFIFQLSYLLLLSLLVFRIAKNLLGGYIDFYIIGKYFISCLFIQSIIALIMFVNRPFCLFMFELQGIDMYSRAIQLYFGVRLIGLGCFYFGAGVIYGLGLILLIPYMLKANSKKTIILLIILYGYLFIIGLFFARTCLIGFGISFLYLIVCIFNVSIRSKAFRVIRQFILWFFIISASLVILYNSVPSIQEEYGEIVNFGFEAFINYSETGELSTKSSDGLKEYHLSLLPDETSTYLLGDTRWNDGEHYYKGTDVGYFRLLYYFGIIGTLLFILYQYETLRLIGKIYHDRKIKLLFIMIFIYEVILLIKGFIDVAAILFLFLHFNYNSEQKRIYSLFMSKKQKDINKCKIETSL